MRRIIAVVASCWICAAAASPPTATAQLAVVPTDHATIQAAVDAVQGMAGATVRIDSNATFSETVTIHDSLVLAAGAGFTPVVQGAAANCQFAGPCTLSWNPTVAGATTFVLRGITLLPIPTATPGSGGRVVEIFNESAGDSTITIDRITIRDPNESGLDGVAIRDAASAAGVNHVTIGDTSIQLGGVPNFAGQGIGMAEEGSLAIERLTLEMHGSSAFAFDLQATSNPFPFSLIDSDITISAPVGPFSAELGRLRSAINASIVGNTFRLLGDDDGGGISGFLLGSGEPATTASVVFDRNRFLGSGGNNRRAAISAVAANGGATNLIARNNLIHGMSPGVRLRPEDLGTIDATLVNNTIVGSTNDAIAISPVGTGSSVNATVVNNLLTHNTESGLAFETGPGAFLITHHHNGYFANIGGDVTGGALATGPDDVIADPLYLNPSGDFHLRTISPMLDRGTSTSFSLSALDLDGEPRIQNGVVDLGAFEGGDPGSVLEVPTLGEFGVSALVALLAAAGVQRMSRKRRRAGP